MSTCGIRRCGRDSLLYSVRCDFWLEEEEWQHVRILCLRKQASSLCTSAEKFTCQYYRAGPHSTGEYLVEHAGWASNIFSKQQ